MKKNYPERPKCRPTPYTGPVMLRKVSMTTCDAGLIVQAVRILRGTLGNILKSNLIPHDACLEITSVSYDTLGECLRTLSYQMPNVQTFELCCMEHEYVLPVRDIEVFRAVLYDYQNHIACCLPASEVREMNVEKWFQTAEHCRVLRRKLMPLVT